MPLSIHAPDARAVSVGRRLRLSAVLFVSVAACSGSSGTGSAGGSNGSAGTGGGSSGSGGSSGTAGTTGAAGTVGSTAGATGAGTAGTGGSQVAGSGGSVGSAGSSGSGGRAGTAGGAGAGGGGRAGTTGAGGGAAGGSAGGAALGCAGKTYKLCEDFETGAVGAIPTGWTALKGFGADSARGVGLATDQFRSGSMALKSDSMVPGEERVQRSLAALGATATKHWGRIFYKVQSPAPKPASGSVIHVTLSALQGTTENRVVDTVEQSNGTHQWIYNVPDDTCCTGSAYSWSFDTNWHCAEWYVDVASQSFRFFTDNTEVTSIGFTGNANAKMSNYTALAVGSIFYQAPPTPFVIWFDDLAIDDIQIHCQ